MHFSVVALIFPAAGLQAPLREDGKPEDDGDVELVSAELVWVEVGDLALPKTSKRAPFAGGLRVRNLKP